MIEKYIKLSWLCNLCRKVYEVKIIFASQELSINVYDREVYKVVLAV